MQVLDMQELTFFEQLPKSITNANFFELLVSEVKKTGTWAQKKLFGIKKLRLKSLEKELELLKSNFEENIFDITKIEKEIAKV